MHGLNINSVISMMGIYASTATCYLPFNIYYLPVSALKKVAFFSIGRMCITMQPVRHCRNTYMSTKYYDCSSHSLPLSDLTCRNGLYLMLMKHLCFWDYAISLKKKCCISVGQGKNCYILWLYGVQVSAFFNSQYVPFFRQ